jgi:uncharacterized LabA/DUF88 family protein
LEKKLYAEQRLPVKVAIMVDAGYYLKRANIIFGKSTVQGGPVSPEIRADELVTYCNRHLNRYQYEMCSLYRIFVYDCPPSEKQAYHPLKSTTVDLRKTPSYKWSKDFHSALVSKRKVAIRMGELLESSIGYTLRPEAIKKLCRKDISIDDLQESDFVLDMKQKGVDMRIGLDIASLANKRLVDRIILIAGDSDFVPAAKYARREGIDFILDPLWQTIKPSLNEHIDGLFSCIAKPPENEKDSLYRR